MGVGGFRACRELGGCAHQTLAGNCCRRPQPSLRATADPCHCCFTGSRLCAMFISDQWSAYNSATLLTHLCQWMETQRQHTRGRSPKPPWMPIPELFVCPSGQTTGACSGCVCYPRHRLTIIFACRILLCESHCPRLSQPVKMALPKSGSCAPRLGPIYYPQVWLDGHRVKNAHRITLYSVASLSQLHKSFDNLSEIKTKTYLMSKN